MDATPSLADLARLRDLAEGVVHCFAWGDWKPVGDKMVSPKGRTLSRATFDRLSKGRASTGGGAKPAPRPHAKPKPPESVLDRLIGFPRRAVNGVIDQANNAYDWAKERYGPNTAKAIIGAGALGLPIPIPGAVLATAAPVLAVAELNRRLFGSDPKPHHKPAPTPAMKKEPDRVKLARAKAAVAHAAHLAAATPGSGKSPEEVAWLKARAQRAASDAKALENQPPPQQKSQESKVKSRPSGTGSGGSPGGKKALIDTVQGLWGRAISDPEPSAGVEAKIGAIAKSLPARDVIAAVRELGHRSVPKGKADAVKILVRYVTQRTGSFQRADA